MYLMMIIIIKINYKRISINQPTQQVRYLQICLFSMTITCIKHTVLLQLQSTHIKYSKMIIYKLEEMIMIITVGMDTPTRIMKGWYKKSVCPKLITISLNPSKNTAPIIITRPMYFLCNQK